MAIFVALRRRNLPGMARAGPILKLLKRQKGHLKLREGILMVSERRNVPEPSPMRRELTWGVSFQENLQVMFRKGSQTEHLANEAADRVNQPTSLSWITHRFCGAFRLDRAQSGPDADEGTRQELAVYRDVLLEGRRITKLGKEQTAATQRQSFI